MNILASGWNDYDVSLSNGYRLVRTNADSVMIYEATAGFVIPPKITGLSIKGNLLFGLCEQSENPDLACVPGYFLLDTQAKIVKVGLAKTNWLAELQKYGISREPTLKKPNRYFHLVNILNSIYWIFLFGCLLFFVLWLFYGKRQKALICSGNSVVSPTKK
jgi:hypothetical protein